MERNNTFVWGISCRGSVGVFCTKQQFHQDEIKVPLTENKSSTSTKQKFHQHETAVSPARNNSFTGTKQKFSLKKTGVLSREMI
ncbi:hypothetical protein DW921_12850 [Phocaeicola coprophilus]|uniref:Uncharacterized protein n=1 Tax=Phocaeicola coprophilus TaxID=387090 RepID=A0A413SWH2_9BACT|nr:hypothetical protein DW921_12850 [Phocaeicola coprophilus]